ncbi:restriction endonuclease subunit S [Holdemanella porci]|uniref:restriction endonuclease subunit S n=1 Tax=Holdemanella porci TaxID=2652276 RepID=UPI0022E0EF24|nr:restriction endonuclease subunit S [Holdemanella porci]
MENNKTPKIRFKGFTDPWEQRKLGDMMNVTSVKRIHQSDWTDSGVRFLRARDIVAAAKNEEPDDYLYISKEKYEEYSALSGKVGVSDLLVTGVGTIGVPYLVRNLEPLYFKDGNIIWFQNSDKIDGKFLFYSFSAEQIQGFINESAGIGTVGTYTIESGKKTPISLPNQIEQAKVGEFFQQLDNLITLHQRKYNKLLNVKKSMLEKMFPKNGSNIPEIRFKGFTDPWEQRKFTDITFLSGEKNKDNLPYESYSVTNENGFVPQNEQFENGGTMATADKRMYYIVSKNSFAYNPARINVGSIGYYDGPENVIVSSLYEVFKTSEDIDDRYLWHWFKSNNFKKLIEQYQEGGVRLYFYYDKLCMCSLPTPSIQEQIKIGRYFDNLDNLITLHQRELEKLQNIKKSMLEKMFV